MHKGYALQWGRCTHAVESLLAKRTGELEGFNGAAARLTAKPPPGARAAPR